jgi:hypothetical protein
VEYALKAIIIGRRKRMEMATKLRIETLPAPTVVVVRNGKPDPETVEVRRGGRILFQNDDDLGYLIRVHSGPIAVDHFLPAFGSTTVVVDPSAKPQTVYYELLPATVPALTTEELVAAESEAVADAPKTEQVRSNVATGGRIIITP